MKKSEKATPKKRTSKKKLSPEQLRQQFDEQLRMRYWVENELVELLPRLLKKATSYELATAIEEQLEIAKAQVICIIHVFDAMQERAVGYKSPEMAALIEEAEKVINSEVMGYAGDASIIAICESIMLLEIDSFKKLFADAMVIGEKKAALYLEDAIITEQHAHSLLAEIALSSIYFEEAG